MTPASESDERPAFDRLARKTVEILDIIDSTRQLVLDGYNNDQTMWLEAMFRILMMKNSSFIHEENDSTIKNPNISQILNDMVHSMYYTSSSQEQNTKSLTTESHLREASCALISCFRVFTNFLLHTQVEVTDELSNLKEITKNIEKYLKIPTDQEEKVKSSLIAHNSGEKVKVKIRSQSEESKKLVEKAASDRKCSICQEVITIYNNDEDFSIILHEQKEKHLEAERKRMASELPKQCKNSSERESFPDLNTGSISKKDENRIRSLIAEKVGSSQAKLFRIDGPERFYCTACKCVIASMFNISSHVDGKPHKKLCNIKDSKIENEKEKPKTSNTNVDPGNHLFRVGTSIPVTSLF